MSTYRKCLVCDGKGQIWATPRLTEDGLGCPPTRPALRNLSDNEESQPSGLNVPCWRCLGKGLTRDSRIDAGDE